MPDCVRGIKDSYYVSRRLGITIPICCAVTSAGHCRIRDHQLQSERTSLDLQTFTY